MHEHGRAGARDVELALQAHVLAVVHERVLRIAQQAADAQHPADHADDDQRHISAHTRRILQVPEALVPDVVVAVEAVDLRGVLPAVEQIQPAERRQQHHHADELPAADADGDGQRLLHQQQHRHAHIGQNPEIGRLHDDVVQRRDGVRQRAEDGRNVDDQRHGGQDDGIELEARMTAHGRRHGVAERRFQQEQRKQVAPDGDHVADLPERDVHVLHARLHIQREEEEAQDVLRVAALLGDEDQDARKLHHQAGAHAQQKQRFAVFAQAQHADGCREHQPDEQEQHGLPSLFRRRCTKALGRRDVSDLRSLDRKITCPLPPSGRASRTRRPPEPGPSPPRRWRRRCRAAGGSSPRRCRRQRPQRLPCR